MQQTSKTAVSLACLTLAAVLAVPTGCGGSHKKAKGGHDLEDAVDKKAECASGDMGACVSIARANCVDKAWSLEYSDSPAVYVSESGLVRVDHQDMLMFSTNTREWLACMESCPGTESKNVCIPFGYEMKFVTQQGANCEKTERDAHPWNGHEAKTLQMDCQEGSWEITYVPEFLEAHKAMVAAGTIDADDFLASVGGLVVETSFSGYPLMSLAAVSKASCALFDLPAGYNVVQGKAAFDNLRDAHPALAANLEAGLLALRDREDDPARLARKQLEPQLKSLCEKSGQPAETDADLDACVENQVAARALVAKVTARALDSFAQKAAPKFQEVLRNEYVAPLCKRFAQ